MLNLRPPEFCQGANGMNVTQTAVPLRHVKCHRAVVTCSDRSRQFPAFCSRLSASGGKSRRGSRQIRLCAVSESGGGEEPTASGADDADGDASAQLKELAQLDGLIDILLTCKSQEELARAVGENILALKQTFWLRLATRSDAASSRQEKEQLLSLSRAVMSLVEAMVQRADEQLTDSSEVLGNILKAAADENGNWHMPLAEREAAALKLAMERHRGEINEAMLSNAFAWMRKAADDKLDGMVALLQKVLQYYAAGELRGDGAEGAEGFLNELFGEDTENWEAKIEQKATSGEISEEDFMKALQMKLENTILLPSGSYAQRVQVEYLSELKTRGQTAFEKAAAES